MPDYKDVLVLCAPPSGVPSPACFNYVQQLHALGALVQFSACYAEVSLTRSVQAAAAMKTLEKHPKLRWVFWLDWDMCSNQAALETLIMASERLWEMGGENSQFPTVCGAYVNRHDVRQGGLTRLAAHAVFTASPIEFDVPDIEHGSIVLHATMALCGMGCLLQSRDCFVAHYNESPEFCYPNETVVVREVCSSGRVHVSELAEFVAVDASKDLFYWSNEDFDYTSRELSHGRPVYLVNVPFGHEFMQVALPDARTVFPGLRPPEAT